MDQLERITIKPLKDQFVTIVNVANEPISNHRQDYLPSFS